MSSESEQLFQFHTEISQVAGTLRPEWRNTVIFLKKFLLNASRDLDKGTDQVSQEPDDEKPFIRITLNDDARTLTITDNGTGMTRDELISKFGTTIVKAETEKPEDSSDHTARAVFSAFFESDSATEASEEANMLEDSSEHLGLALYSAFLVSDSVTVTSKTAAGACHQWQSTGDSSFTVKPLNNFELDHGTKIGMHIIEREREFLLEGFIEHHLELDPIRTSYPIGITVIPKECKKKRESLVPCLLDKVPVKICLEIFEKMTAQSFSRTYRSKKWVNQLLEDNKNRIKIHTHEMIHFGVGTEDEEPPRHGYVYILLSLNPCQSVIMIKRWLAQETVARIFYKTTELDAILSRAEFKCFIFSEVQHHRLQPAGSLTFRQHNNREQLLNDSKFTAERIPAVFAKKYTLCSQKDAPLPNITYNYADLHIFDIDKQPIEPFFNLVKKRRNVRLDFLEKDKDPVEEIVRKFCQEIQHVLDGRSATKSLQLTFDRSVKRTEVLKKFLNERRSDKIAEAERVWFHLVPMTQTSLLAVEWSVSGDDSKYSFKVVNNRGEFWNCYEGVRYAHGRRVFRDEEEIHFPPVGEVYSRYFS